MRTKLFIALAAVFVFALSFYAPREASAVPAFARQTGLACNTCHYQHFPTLNAFGRAFKADGYTMAGGQSLIEGDFLSMPADLNASLITKIRYQKNNGTTAGGRNKGVLQFPDEAALLLGGRAGEHVGFLLELTTFGETGDADGSVGDHAHDVSFFASFRVPFTYTIGGSTKVAVIPFTTDAFGPSYGFELLNTGAQRSNRPIEHREEISAQQFLGTDTAATGIAFAVYRDLYYATYSLWSNTHGDTDAGPYLHYARVAFTPTYAGWDLGAGVQWWGGTSKRDNAYEKADAWALDAQAQGTIAAYPVGFYVSYGEAPKSTAGETANIFNQDTAHDAYAFGLLAEVGVVPGRLTVSAGYLNGEGAGTATANTGMNGNRSTETQTAFTLGANYHLAQNVNLVWNSSFYGGNGFDPKPASRGDSLHTLMVFSAF